MSGPRKYLLASLPLLALVLAGCGDRKPEETGQGHTAAPAAAPYDHAALMRERTGKDDYFRQDGSPIPEAKRATFSGLQYFPPDTALAFDLDIARLPNPEQVSIGATKGDVRAMRRYGTFSFTVDGKPCTLAAFTSESNPGALFVPFKDATNGTETYEVGRYLDLEIREDGRYRLDFNLAYNPYCAYNPDYTCPLVPDENILEAAIRAGEKLPADAVPH